MTSIKVPTQTLDEVTLSECGESVYLYRDNVDASTATPIESRDITVKASDGDASVAMVSSALGLGTTTKYKLPHSGFQIAVPVVDELKRLSILEEINTEIINANIDTLGVVNSTSDGVLGEITTMALLEHVISSTLDVSKRDIWKYIDFRDLEFIKVILGHKLNRDKPYTMEHTCPLCDSKMEVEMELSSLLYVDNEKIPEENSAILNNKVSKSIKPKTCKAYQTTPINGDAKKEKEIVINDNVTFVIDSSTLERYFECTHVWYDSIVKTIDDAIVSDTSDEDSIIEDKRLLVRKLIVSSYLPYIKAIKTNGKTITKPVPINRILNNLLSVEEFVVPLIKGIDDWIKTNTFAFVGIPAYVCDTCKGVVEGDDIPSIIPINASQLFIEVCRVIRNKLV